MLWGLLSILDNQNHFVQVCLSLFSSCPPWPHLPQIKGRIVAVSWKPILLLNVIYLTMSCEASIWNFGPVFMRSLEIDFQWAVATVASIVASQLGPWFNPEFQFPSLWNFSCSPHIYVSSWFSSFLLPLKNTTVYWLGILNCPRCEWVGECVCMVPVAWDCHAIQGVFLPHVQRSPFTVTLNRINGLLIINELPNE